MTKVSKLSACIILFVIYSNFFTDTVVLEGQQLDFGGPPAKRQRLYGPTELEVKPWISCFEWTHQDEGTEEVTNYIGVSIGADGFFNPLVKVVEDGWMLEIVANVSNQRVNLNNMYKARRDKFFSIMVDPKASEMDKAAAKDAYDRLLSCRVAESKVVTEMKTEFADNWKLQFLRIPLDKQVEKKLVTNEILGNRGIGIVLSIDLKIITDTFEEAAEAKQASPAKQS